MAGFTEAFEKVLLEHGFPTSGASDYVGYSSDGTTETTVLTRTFIEEDGWAASTGGSPSTKANAALVAAANVTADVTLTHWAAFDAATGGMQKTDWTPLAAARQFFAGDNPKWAAGDLTISLD